MIVLLVVGLNISGMMLGPQRDPRARAGDPVGMGASRWRLMRHHLTEALVLALFGGAFASAVLFFGPVAVAWAFDPGLDLFRPDGIIRSASASAS